MERTVARAKELGVAVGAHPGFPDLVGFGRRVIQATADEVRTDTLYQIYALAGFCRAAGIAMQHVKAHGALYNAAVKDAVLADAIAAGVAAADSGLAMLAQPGTPLAAAAEVRGLALAREGFIDRAYNADGTLVSRRQAGALVTDPGEAAERCLRLVLEGRLRAIDGTDLQLTVDSLCVHSDTPGAVAILTRARAELEAAGVTIRAFGRP
jgi:5-oxoprolinase (ATP-hydrolysing) subunit A